MLKESIIIYMRDILGITGSDAEELFDCYVETLEQLCQKLEQAVEQHNVMEIRNITHSIMGSSSNIGANIISEQAAAANMAAKSHDFGSVKSLSQELKKYPEILRK
ncbi:MAG: Hpt domain-containing protein [Victivallaceae bacterium]|nr:Hpt domain-containing protein [Victivallaceae bacterium]MDD4180299.1 Hpt domain-containing protein [Victivallaceae bacterium]